MSTRYSCEVDEEVRTAFSSVLSVRKMASVGIENPTSVTETSSCIGIGFSVVKIFMMIWSLYGPLRLSTFLIGYFLIGYSK